MRFEARTLAILMDIGTTLFGPEEFDAQLGNALQLFKRKREAQLLHVIETSLREHFARLGYHPVN